MFRISFDPVRESEGECAWETCQPDHAEAWRVTRTDGDDVRAWTFKDRKTAAIAAQDLSEGRAQPLGLSRLARLSTRTVYIRG